MNLRPALPADAAALAELGRSTFVETFGGLYPEADFQAFLDATYGEARQRAELEDPACRTFVAEDGGGLQGFVLLRRGAESCVKGPDPVELQRIYVRKAAHGSGLGAALMAKALEEARAWGGRTLWLGVWEHNARALAFYCRQGFVAVGEHPFRIGSVVDRDLILERPL